MRYKVWLVASLLVLFLAGCSLRDRQNDTVRPRAWLAPGVRVSLPAPGIVPAIRSQQLLHGRVHGHTQSLVVLLDADSQKITLAGLSSLGIRLFLVTYDERGIHTEQSIVLPQLPPASQVLADVMLSYWPVAVWQPQLPPGWRLIEHGNFRTLYDARGNRVVSVDYLERDGKREPISIEQHAFNYRIAIQYLGH